ncbi:MAG: C25 family cysteine peptidase, partial [Bacteroidota bacterium]
MQTNFTRAVTIFLFSIFTLTAVAGSNEWNYLSGNTENTKSHTSINVVKSSPTETELIFSLDGFKQTPVKTPNGNAFVISSSKLTRILESGAPDLAKMAFSIAIPDHAAMVVDEINSSFTTYSNVEVAPCKGNIYRNIDPATVPYTYGNAYSQNQFYPGQLVLLQHPYIVRDLRGQSVWVFPFQYNPVTKELRVYSEIHFKVKTNGTSIFNALSRIQPITKVDPYYSSIYRSHFVNHNSIQYTLLPDAGNMLVICYDQFMPAMQPFIDWKNKMGQYTEMIPFSSVGTTAADLKTYIENYYNTTGLTFVLLVGDGAQIPVGSTQYGESDAQLGYILGNDSYAEVIVGRFSAETIAEVETQVDRTITYEAFPDPTGQWYHKAVCIGSDQGPGDDNEMDYEHERNMRTDEIGYTYTDVDELYDGNEGGMDATGNPAPIDLVNSLNDGRSVITYTGHGSCGSFGTTSFSTNNVSALANTDMLPFLWAVACVNGQFNGYDCLAEAFMRSTDGNGKATGAIATFMSTINQSWDPPMDAQDEFVDILTEQYASVNIKRSFGGISVNGCMHMNDQYGTAGDEMTDTWTCFGDPSLMIRTATPTAMTVTHDLVIDETATSFMVNCYTDGALICLSKNSQIISTHIALLGLCNIQNISGLVVGDTLDVTATAFNMMPYFGKVIVTSVTGIADQPENANSFSVSPSVISGSHTMIKYSLTQNSAVKIDITNNLGQHIQNVSDATQQKGLHNIEVDLNDLSKGVYFIRLNNSGKILSKKIVIQ